MKVMTIITMSVLPKTKMTIIRETLITVTSIKTIAYIPTMTMTRMKIHDNHEDDNEKKAIATTTIILAAITTTSPL